MVRILARRISGYCVTCLGSLSVSCVFTNRARVSVDLTLDGLGGVFNVGALLLRNNDVLSNTFTRTSMVSRVDLMMDPVVTGARSGPLFVGDGLSRFALTGIGRCSNNIL